MRQTNHKLSIEQLTQKRKANTLGPLDIPWRSAQIRRSYCNAGKLCSNEDPEPVVVVVVEGLEAELPRQPKPEAEAIHRLASLVAPIAHKGEHVDDNNHEVDPLHLSPSSADPHAQHLLSSRHALQISSQPLRNVCPPCHLKTGSLFRKKCSTLQKKCNDYMTGKSQVSWRNSIPSIGPSSPQIYGHGCP